MEKCIYVMSYAHSIRYSPNRPCLCIRTHNVIQLCPGAPNGRCTQRWGGGDTLFQTPAWFDTIRVNVQWNLRQKDPLNKGQPLYISLTSSMVWFKIRTTSLWGTIDTVPVCPLFRVSSIVRLIPVVLAIDSGIAIQWTPSNPATLGTSQRVLIRGVDSFQEWICTRKHTLK